MSTRYEGADARYTSTTIRHPGEEIGEDTVEPGQIAVAFNYDECFYLVGTPEELRTLLQDTLNKLPTATP